MTDRDRTPGTVRPKPPSLEYFKAAVEDAAKHSVHFQVFMEQMHEAGFRLWAWCPTCGATIGATSHGPECPASVYPPAEKR